MRPTCSFPEAVAEAIARDRYHHPDPRVQQRRKILWLKSRNRTHGDSAELAHVSRPTVQRALRIDAARARTASGRSAGRGSPAPRPRTRRRSRRRSASTRRTRPARRCGGSTR